MTSRFDPLQRPDRYDLRLEDELYSEAASRAAFRRAVPRRTPEQQHQLDLNHQQYWLTCRLDKLYLARREPSPAVVIEREGRGLTLYDRMRVCFSLTPGEATRLTLDEAQALQTDFPIYLAGTIIRSIDQ
jgi:hypothetical protein